jgi:hypothetical protein
MAAGRVIVTRARPSIRSGPYRAAHSHEGGRAMRSRTASSILPKMTSSESNVQRASGAPRHRLA